MEDFANILHRDYGLKPGGKSAPMTGGSHSRAGSSGGAGLGQRSGSASRMANDDVFSSVFNPSPVNGVGARSSSSGALYDDVFGGAPTGVRPSSNDAFGDLLGGFNASGTRPPQASQNSFTEDLLGGFGASKPAQAAAAHGSSSSLDDIFSGGVGTHGRSSSHNSFANHDDDPFGSFGVPKAEAKATQSQALFDDDWSFGASKPRPSSRGAAALHGSMDGDLLGGFSSSSGRSKQATVFRSPQSSPPRAKQSEPVFDEFLPGFGGGEQGKAKAVSDADAMRGIPIISADEDDVFGSVPSSTSGATPDPFGDIPGAKSSGEGDPPRGPGSVAALDADEMRGIPAMSSSPIPDDDPFSSGAEADPFANIIAGSVPPPAASSYADPLDVFDLPPAASVPSGGGGGEGASGGFGDGSGSFDPFDGFPHPPPVATAKAKAKEDGTPSRSGSGSEGREAGSRGSSAWEERQGSRRGFGGVPFNVDLNEAPEVASPSYPSGAAFEEGTETGSNGFAAKADGEPKFDEPSVGAGDERRRKHDTDKVPVDIFGERWVTVDDVKLVTAPSAARAPSRAPPRPGFERRRSSRGSANHRDSAGERSRGRSDELPAYRGSSRSNGEEASKEAELARERAAARDREVALVQKEREAADRERAARQRERAERQRERERERERVREQEAAARSGEAARERADGRNEASSGRDDEAAERAKRAGDRAAREAQQRVEKAAADRAIAEARERAEKAASARAAAARESAREKEQREKEQREREERERREREEKARRARAKEERERERERREKEERERERERREKEEREKERERDRERDRRRERERGAAEQPRGASASSRATSEPRQRPSTSQAAAAAAAPAGVDVRRPSAGNPVYSSTGSSPAFSPAPRRPQAPVKAVDDWTTLLTQTAPTGDEFQDMPGETAERRKLRLERHQKTIERAQLALKEKNDRDKALLMEQAERSRSAGNLDAEVRRWATGKEGNLRALLSSLHLVLWPESNWKPLSLTDLITGISVKKAYQRAILCVHPDKVQQKGATVQQKYTAEKVFDLLKEAFAKFNSTELY